MATKSQRRPWEGASVWEPKRLGDSYDARILARWQHSFNALEVSRG